MYWFLFFPLGVVYVIGLFVPLMDNDSAHHANIALRMYLTGDYASLVSEGKDYLDKPHLLFWLSAFSFHLFGVTPFAYKLPSLLFTVFGTYSTYRLGKSLYNAEAGKLAALIIASSFAYILANNDVRMDAILTACVAFASWQLVDWADRNRFANVVGASLGLALGFATKGWIGVVIPVIGIFFYLLYKKNRKLFYHWQLPAIVLLFFVFISPVLYCYYLQFDLHPEKIIRNKSHWSGVKFILWQQVFERYEGSSFGQPQHKNYFFFFHSFLWAFAPWSVLAYIAFIKRAKSFLTRQTEWLTIGTFTVVALMLTFSGFKLPHYINIVFPASAVLTAGFLLEQYERRKNIKPYWVIQTVVGVLCLIAAGIINLWSFPVRTILIVMVVIFVLVAAIILLRNLTSLFQKTITLPVLVTTLIFFLLNAHVYPRLLQYQAGGELAFTTKEKVNPKNVYFWQSIQAHSYIFNTKELKKNFTDSVYRYAPSPVWVLTDNNGIKSLRNSFPQQKIFYHPDYGIEMLRLSFLNPKKRKQQLDTMYLVKVK